MSSSQASLRRVIRKLPADTGFCTGHCSGFEPHELIGLPSLDLVHPDEFPQVRAIHYSTITQDQAAVLAYLRMRHKDPCRGYILCAIVSAPTRPLAHPIFTCASLLESRTVCQNVLVGSVSFASPGPKALHNASTAQEITVITPTAKDFEFRVCVSSVLTPLGGCAPAMTAMLD